ncbi:MAG: hypothetical protein JNJ63_08235 [Hyphomonadaceae bacterium]|nr:hypothetical protein [Hyphomonadaceae bacterium]
MAGLVIRLVAALLSGAMLAQAHSLEPLWPIAWFAPIPLLLAVANARASVAALLGAITGAASVGGLFAYLLSLGGPAPVAIVVALDALTWGLIALAWRAGVRRLPTFAAILVLPAMAMGLETLIAAYSPHGSANSLAYSQMDFLPAIQVAAFGGAPAVTFLVALFAATGAIMIIRRSLFAAVAPGLILAAALGWGWSRIPPSGPLRESEVLHVALLAGDQFGGVPHDWRPVFEAYAAQVEMAADGDHRVIVMPEKIAFLTEAEREAALERFAEIARRRDVVMVVGVDVEEEGARYNRAYVFRSDGERLSYDKRHMIPGLEQRYTPGRQSVSFERGASRLGVAICKDMDFPALGRSYPGARVMLVPAWDFGVDRWLHSRMAILRGVENGYTIVRSARNGALTVSDRYGRVLAEAVSGPQTLFEAEAPLGAPGPTIYERVGDVFGWVSLALFLLLVIWAGFSRARAGQNPAKAD